MEFLSLRFLGEKMLPKPIFKIWPSFKEFDRNYRLKRHQESKACVKNCNYVCPNCEQGFISSEKLNIHIKKNCTKKFKCYHCASYFRVERELLFHFQTYHP